MEKTMSLAALLMGAGYEYDGEEYTVTGVTDDTRDVRAGNIFACVKGGSFDGHSAAKEMIGKGAAAVICDHDTGLGDRQIIVNDVRSFYGRLVAEWYGHPEREMTLVGVTGTNGKTTMTAMLHHILGELGGRTGLIGTAGTFIGDTPVDRDESTPTTPKVSELYAIFRRMADEGCKYCVMEVSSFATHQNRIGPAVYKAAAFTNLTQDHLDYHQTMENYYQAKKLLFTDHCENAVINIGDSYGRRLYEELGDSVNRISCSEGGDVYPENIKRSGGGSEFTVCVKDGNGNVRRERVALKMMGSYNIDNACEALAICVSLGIPLEKAAQSMNSFGGVRGRCEIIPTGRDFYIVCDYAHSPDALENMLPAIKENTEGRLICLFGCGGDRDRKKRPLMAMAAEKYSDYLIVTSDNPRSEDPDAIIDEIVTGLTGRIPCDRVTDRQGAVFHAVRIAKKGDVIVLAGKGHEDYQILKNNVHIHFDEREICAAALAALDDRELATKMSLSEISRAAEGEMCNISDPDRLILAGNISSDTRTIGKDSLFIALKGERFDGNDFAADAIEKGAAAAVTDRRIEGVPSIVTADTGKALMSIAAHYRRKFALKLVGITGSVGKTTTKEMTALALSSCFETLKTKGNLNNEIGMPTTLLRLTPEHEAAVIEMGMSHFGEIERLSGVCRPTIAVITNIGWSHAENLGSRENILKAKLEILRGSEPDAPLIVNGDDDLLLPLKNTLTGRRVITCGVVNKDCDITAENIVTDENSGKVSFDIIHDGITTPVTLPCIGTHHVKDALLAFAAAVTAGCEADKAAEALSRFEAEGLRQHIEHKKGQQVIVDCYNAAPDSVRAALDVLRDTPCEGRRCAVLGDMLELGSRSPELHEEIGRYAALNGADMIISCGKFGENTVKGALSAGSGAFAVCADKENIVSLLREQLHEGDSVLFKASRGVHFEDIINEYYG